MFLINGDVIKIKDDIYNYLNKKLEEKEGFTFFENKFIVQEENVDNVYIYGQVIKSANKEKSTRSFVINKKKTEVVQLMFKTFSAYSNFNDLMEMNTISNDILLKLKKCDVRTSGKTDFDVVKIKNDVMLSYVDIDKKLQITSIYDSKDKIKQALKKNRKLVKPIKAINEILKANNHRELNQEEIDSILGALSQRIDADFIIVKGDDIVKYYYEEQYVQSGGSLNNSCMRGQLMNRCPAFFNLYKDNTEMLILKDRKKDLIYGRALIWRNVELVDSNTDDIEMYIDVMDRIYTTHDRYVTLFKMYADERNIMYPKVQHAQPTEWIYKGKLIRVDNDNYYLRIQLTNPWLDYGVIPYLDTFCVANIDNESYLYSEGSNVSATADGTVTDGRWDFNSYHEEHEFYKRCLKKDIDCRTPYAISREESNSGYIKRMIEQTNPDRNDDDDDDDEDFYDDWD